ncbi:MAG: hypothetical protein WBQ95_01455 [Terracidiphilus sp.]
MNKPRNGYLGVISKTIVACAVLCGVSIGQSSPELPKGNKRPAEQTILFNPVSSRSARKIVPLEATASSGLPVSFRSTAPSICTISKYTAHLHSDGICTIQVSQAGNGHYAAASDVTQSFTVKSATRCCNLFDIAQDGTVVLPSTQVRKPAFCPTPALDPQTPLTPDIWIPGTTVQITVKGTGFTNVANATKACPATVITVDVANGTVTLSDVKVLNSTTITGTIRTSEDMPGQPAHVNLWGPDPNAKQKP